MLKLLAKWAPMGDDGDSDDENAGKKGSKKSKSKKSRKKSAAGATPVKRLSKKRLTESFFQKSRTVEKKLDREAALRAEERVRKGSVISANPLAGVGDENENNDDDEDGNTGEESVVDKKDLFRRARASLRLSAVPDSLPCRESQADELRTRIETSLLTKTGGSVFMGGLPGTGKTATVREVVRKMDASTREGSLEPFVYIEINAMELTRPELVYGEMARALSQKPGVSGDLELAAGGPVASAPKVTDARRMLAKLFKHAKSPREVGIVALIDEMDLLVTRKQTVLYNLFDWAASPHSRLFVIGVANTIDLPERMLPRVHSRLGVHIIKFPSYSVSELETIVQSRLHLLPAFDAAAIALCARKVAAISGDARRALELCRRAAELAEAEDEASKVTPSHIYDAIKSMISSPIAAAIMGGSFHERLFLVALFMESRSSGSQTLMFPDIAAKHITLSRTVNVQPPSTSDLKSIVTRLGATRILLIEGPHKDLYQRIRFNVALDDFTSAMRNDPVLGIYVKANES